MAKKDYKGSADIQSAKNKVEEKLCSPRRMPCADIGHPRKARRGRQVAQGLRSGTPDAEHPDNATRVARLVPRKVRADRGKYPPVLRLSTKRAPNPVRKWGPSSIKVKDFNGTPLNGGLEIDRPPLSWLGSLRGSC